MQGGRWTWPEYCAKWAMSSVRLGITCDDGYGDFSLKYWSSRWGWLFEGICFDIEIQRMLAARQGTEAHVVQAVQSTASQANRSAPSARPAVQTTSQRGCSLT